MDNYIEPYECQPCCVCGEPACGCKLCDKQHYCPKHLPRETVEVIAYGQQIATATYGDYEQNVPC